MTILLGSGRFIGAIMLKPNGKPKVTGIPRNRNSRVIPSRLARPSPRVRNSIVSWPPMPTIGHQRDAGRQRGPDVAGPTAEVDDVGPVARPVDVVLAAGKDQERRVEVGEHVLGGVAVGGQETPATHDGAHRAGEQDVVAQQVERPLDAVPLPELRGQHRCIERDRTPRVVADEQRATLGDPLEPTHLGAVPQGHHRVEHGKDPPQVLRVALDLGGLVEPCPRR